MASWSAYGPSRCSPLPSLRLERFIAPTRSNRLMAQSGAYATAAYLCLWCYSWALGGGFLTTLSVNMLVGAFG